VNHQEALQRLAVEKYLLKEMPDPERDEFEEHFFGCPECAEDLRTTAAFLDGAKQALRRSPAPSLKSAPGRPPRTFKKTWFEFLWRPAFAAPAFALLLGVMVYQNVAIFPRFAGDTSQAGKPEILTSLSLIGGNGRGGAGSSATLGEGQPLLISLDIPTAERFSSYACILVASSGAVVWRLPVSPTQAKDTVAIRVPSGLLARGEYRLIVQGHANSQGPSADLANYRFTLNSPN